MRIVMHGHHAGTLFSYNEARAALDEASAAHNKASAAHIKARAMYFASFDRDTFHRQHCQPWCPWDGRTIFARGITLTDDIVVD